MPTKNTRKLARYALAKAFELGSEGKSVSEIKIQYFIDYWRDLTHQNNSVESELVHSILYNPKELFKEFMEEVERKNLSNNDNKKFFIDTINEFAKLDLDALNFIKPILKLIQQQFSKKDDYSYLLHLLKMIQLKLENFTLGKESVKELAKILTDHSNINKTKIKHLVNLLIFEMIHKKYSRESIHKMINDIFSTYQILPNDVVHSNFPHKFKSKNYGGNKSTEYQSELKSYIDRLKDKDRILALGNYLDKEPEELRFVFQIKGLRGDNVNITIGNVQIYNPKTTKLFKNQTEYFNELFKEEIKDDIYYCNGAVALKVLDIKFAKQEALQILENTLDFISSKYIYHKIPIVINASQYYAIDKDGNQRGSGFDSTWEYLAFQDSIELDNLKYNNSTYSKFISKNKVLEIDKKILESMHWKRKAIESNENNEKILWHWVMLENIFERKNYNTPKTIFEVVSKLLTKKYMYNFAWKHFHKLNEITIHAVGSNHYELQLNLPQDLKNKIGLNTKVGEQHNLKDFIDNINELQIHINRNSLFFEQLEYLKDIFTNNEKCLDLIGKFEKIFFEKLVYVYRMRNKIVHNAYNESNPVSQYYVNFITLASSISINVFVQMRENFSLQTNNDIINNIIYEYDEFKLNLKEKGISVLL